MGLAACNRVTTPPLEPIYVPTHGHAGAPPLIVIPGAFGSKLRNRRTKEELWPAGDPELIVSNYRGIELEIDPQTLDPVTRDVEAHDIFRNGLGRDFYGAILDVLRSAAGYVKLRPGDPPPEGARVFYVYNYDWRLDNITAVGGLHRLIESIRADHGDPALQVDILAHSNGGLLARYYARYGTAELPEQGLPQFDFEGRRAIRRLLMVGTPNLGTLQPVLSYARGEEVGLRRIPREVVATCTGAPQMMPHPDVPWLIDVRGEVVHHDVYDIGTWRELGWSVFDTKVRERVIANHGGGTAGQSYYATLLQYMEKHLERGRRFAFALSAPACADDIAPLVFGADCEPTLRRLVIEQTSGGQQMRESVKAIARPRIDVDYASLMYEPGDAVVTRSSLLGRRSLNVAAPRAECESLKIAHSVFICEQHQQLTGNPMFQDNLLNALLSSDLP
jgi:pimeloyl-ACP methyl ester carboxylesterase